MKIDNKNYITNTYSNRKSLLSTSKTLLSVMAHHIEV